MDPATEKPQPMQYHIQIAGIDPLQVDRCDRQIIDGFLATLFDPKGSGLEDSPLQYKKHEYSVEDSSISSASVLRVEFRLTDDAERSGKTLVEAAEGLCKHILDPRAESSLKTLSPFGLLGVSALSDPFKRCWTQAFFGDYAVNGPELLKRVDDEFNNYLPQWALALSFAVVIGADFGIFCNAKEGSPCTTDVSIIDAITIGSSILEKYTRNLKPNASKQEEVWNTRLATNLRTVVTKLEEVTSLENINLSNNGDRPSPSDDLCNALYEATLADAKIATSNQEYLKGFLSFSKLAGANAVGAGLAAAGKTAFAAGGASWGLAKATTGFTASHAPTAFSPILSSPAPVVVGAAVVYAAWWFFYGRRKSMRRQYHDTEDALMRCYRLMNETFSLVRCIELTDSGPFPHNRPLSLRFTNDYCRDICTGFIRSVQMHNPVGQDVEPRMVLNYLGEQLTEMRNLVNTMDGLLEE